MESVFYEGNGLISTKVSNKTSGVQFPHNMIFDGCSRQAQLCPSKKVRIVGHGNHDLERLFHLSRKFLSMAMVWLKLRLVVSGRCAIYQCQALDWRRLLSMLVINALLRRKRSAMDWIFMDSRLMIQELTEVKISHICREGKQGPDWLANESRENQPHFL